MKDHGHTILRCAGEQTVISFDVVREDRNARYACRLLYEWPLCRYGLISIFLYHREYYPENLGRYLVGLLPLL